jgi:serine/threonine-protein kinase
MPSEQRAFHPHYSSDIYAVGVVCMQALTGLSPSDLPMDTQNGELSCAAFRDRAAIAPEFAAILDKMVRYDYRQRYPNAAEALRALQRMLGTSRLIDEDEPATLPFSHRDSVETEVFVADLNSPAQPTSGQRSQPTSKPTQTLSVAQQKQLETLLAESIGPISTVVLRQALSESSTYPDLVDRLVSRLPEQRRTAFREKVASMFKEIDPNSTASQYLTVQPTASTTPQTMPAPAIAPEFIKRCEVELAKHIGPIAPMMVKRALTQYPDVSNAQLIDLLIKHLPNQAAEVAFRKALKV